MEARKEEDDRPRTAAKTMMEVSCASSALKDPARQRRYPSEDW